MLVDSAILTLITSFASFFLQIISIVQQLMQESFESIFLVLISVITAWTQ